MQDFSKTTQGKIDDEILNICKVANIQREIKESAEISDRILEAVRIIEKETKATKRKVSNTSINVSILSVNSEQPTEVETIEPNVENVQNSTNPNPDNGGVVGISDDSNNVTNNSIMSEQIASAPNVHLAASLPKLPKLQLLKFSGKLSEWNSFWDSYHSAIHSNPSISKVNKFNYLHNHCLKGVHHERLKD